jgi:hypothetical protein
MEQIIDFRRTWKKNWRGIPPIGFVLKYSSEGEKQMSMTFRGRKKERQRKYIVTTRSVSVAIVAVGKQ